MQKGYQISFFTEQSRRKDGRPMGNWILETAKNLEIPGATLFPAAEGYGRGGWLKSASFFESGEQSVEVRVAVTEADAERLIERIRSENLGVFCVKTPIEFGIL